MSNVTDPCAHPGIMIMSVPYSTVTTNRLGGLWLCHWHSYIRQYITNTQCAQLLAA